MSKLAKMIADNLTAGMAPVDAASKAQTDASAVSIGTQQADTLAQWTGALVAASGISNEIVGRVVRHIDDNGIVTASGSRRHNGHGGAAGERTSGADWAALGITRIRIGTKPLERGDGYDIPATKWAQVLRAAAMFATTHGGFRTNKEGAPDVTITAESEVNDFTGASSAALILRTNKAIAPFVAMYDGKTWRTRDDVAEALAK